MRDLDTVALLAWPDAQQEARRRIKEPTLEIQTCRMSRRDTAKGGKENVEEGKTECGEHRRVVLESVAG